MENSFLEKREKKSETAWCAVDYHHLRGKIKPICCIHHGWESQTISVVATNLSPLCSSRTPA